jgi:hypothetical protein
VAPDGAVVDGAVEGFVDGVRDVDGEGFAGVLAEGDGWSAFDVEDVAELARGVAGDVAAGGAA